MKVRISAYLEELEDQKEENLANKNMLHADWIIKEAFSFCSVVEEMIVKDDKYDFEKDKTLDQKEVKMIQEN